MAEEHGFQAAEGHTLCANNCGFFGSSTTLNLCSKCYRDLCLKEEQASSAKSAVEKSLFASTSSTTVLPLTAPEIAVDLHIPATTVIADPSTTDDQPPTQTNRCTVCRKRVGLTGFRCRCGTTYCGTHRYPENHGCTFDFKAVGKEEIARSNPVVKAEKLDKI